jgi:hypothetical protein
LHSIGHYQVEVNKGFGDVLIHPKYTLDAIFFIIDNVSKAGETLRGTGRLLFQRRIRGRSQSIDQGYRWMIQNGQDALEGVNAIGGGNDDGKIDARWQRRRLVLEQYGTTNGNLKKANDNTARWDTMEPGIWRSLSHNTHGCAIRKGHHPVDEEEQDQDRNHGGIMQTPLTESFLGSFESIHNSLDCEG